MSDKLFSVIDYGAIADGKTLCTASVQSAIDDCANSGGGTVYFPDGEFVLSTVFLKSRVKIEFSNNTQILGSLNFNDYCKDERVDYIGFV